MLDDVRGKARNLSIKSNFEIKKIFEKNLLADSLSGGSTDIDKYFNQPIKYQT